MTETKSQCHMEAAQPKKKPVGPDGKPLKPCCVCLETKGLRDECVINRGQDNCGDFIEAHKKCLRDLGFNI